MSFQLHGIRQQRSENESSKKSCFIFCHPLIERPKIYTLLLGNYSYVGLSQALSLFRCDNPTYIYMRKEGKCRNASGL